MRRDEALIKLGEAEIRRRVHYKREAIRNRLIIRLVNSSPLTTTIAEIKDHVCDTMINEYPPERMVEDELERLCGEK